jgi:hypothetical protein
MSLAGDYAIAYAAAEAQKASAVATDPPPFVGPNGRAEVTPLGRLHLIQTTSGDFEIPAAGALLFAAWITQTFG